MMMRLMIMLRTWFAQRFLIVLTLLLSLALVVFIKLSHYTHPAGHHPTLLSAKLHIIAAIQDEQHQTYNATAFFQTISYKMSDINGIAFSPDGKYILITSDQSGVFNAYAQPTTIINGTSEQQYSIIVALTNSTINAVIAISYFPSDSRILYSSDQGGDELDHIYVRDDRQDGTVKVQDLTPGENIKALFGGWRDTGHSFFIHTNERDERFFDVYEYYTATDDDDVYKRMLLFQNDLELDISSISPDGRWLACAVYRTSADSNIYLVDLQQQSVEGKNKTASFLITKHQGNVEHTVYTFTRDSATLIYSTDEFGEFSQAWTHQLTTNDKAPLVQSDWDVSWVILSPTGRYRVSGTNVDARTETLIHDTETNKTLELPAGLPAGQVDHVRFSTDEKKLAFIINSDTSPSDIFVVSLQSLDFLQLTSALNPEIRQKDLVDGQVIRYESFDLLEIPSILYKPKSASADNKVPALVHVHGGPGGQSVKEYAASKQHLVNHGYAILAVNNRGSYGYGKSFYHMDDRRHGDVDLQDVVYGKRYLESLDWIDPNRIGIIGGSYGGFMTVAALAFEPEVFDVGIDMFGVTNWLRTLESIPAYWESEKEEFFDEMGDPATDEERLRSISPLFHADQINKPLLVVQGVNDPRVPKVESDEIVAALKNNSVPVEYLLFEDEGHGFEIRSNRIQASEAYLSFLTKYLTGSVDFGSTVGPNAETDSTTTSGSSVAFLLSRWIWCALLAMLIL